MSPRKGKKVGGRRATPSSLKPGAESAVMTLQDVADYLHCHTSTVYRLLKEREVPGFKMGRGWRFLKSDVDKWIAKGGGRN
jgi:excisionase family DNA binding protein